VKVIGIGAIVGERLEIQPNLRNKQRSRGATPNGPRPLERTLRLGKEQSIQLRSMG
jgi:hypothetical protein